jgi:hypothetical protein
MDETVTPGARQAWVPPPTWFAVGLAILSSGAAGIHGSVMGEHFRESALFGIFFAGTSGLQLAWAFLVLTRPSGPLLAWGTIVNALIVCIWVVTRTAGLPFGPDPGVAEAATFVDVVTTVLEIGLVIGCIVALQGRSAAMMRKSRRALTLGVCLSVAAGGAAVLALISASTPGESPGGDPAGASGHAVHLAIVVAAAGVAAVVDAAASRFRSRGAAG